jgi:hypothetical protein
LSKRHSTYRSDYGINRRGKRTTHSATGGCENKTRSGIGHRHPDMPAPPKRGKKG